MRVFLTGGTGLIGSHLAARLRARGDAVVALVRPGARTAFLDGLGCTLVAGDVRDPPDVLAPLARGCDAVVHGAALVYAGARWPEVRAVNVDGTAHVVGAASRAGVPVVVHVSSVAVYGNAPAPIDEDTPTDAPLAPGDLYARSKREAERVARDEAERAGFALALLRPSAVYGERDRLLSARVAALARRRVVPVLGSGRNTIPLVYAGNVAGAIERCLDRPPAAPARAYDLGLDHPLTQEGLLLGMARALGARPRVVHVPGAVVLGAARLGERLGLTVPGAGDLSLARFARLALGDNPYPSLRIRRELGWAPAVGAEEALARTARWIVEEAHRDGGR